MRPYRKANGFIPTRLGPSRFNQRLHRSRALFLTLFAVLGETWKELNAASVYSIDSFPIAACDNYRIRRCKRSRDKVYRGDLASKKRFCYGFKMHVLATAEGEPVDFFLTPSSFSDVACLEDFDWDLPPDSTVYADRAYNDAEFENTAQTDSRIEFPPMRRANMKQQFPPGIRYLQHPFRKRIETTGSLLEQRLPKSIHAVTARGFELMLALRVNGFR